MIVDSSAVVAILRQEPEAAAMARALETTSRAAISAATVLEAAIVIGPAAHHRLDDLLRETDTEVVPFDHEQARLAREAYARFGKRSGSRARLNFGDCISYALARTTGEPLLFKGDDFAHTDVTPALPSS